MPQRLLSAIYPQCDLRNVPLPQLPPLQNGAGVTRWQAAETLAVLCVKELGTAGYGVGRPSRGLEGSQRKPEVPVLLLTPCHLAVHVAKRFAEKC